MSSYKLPQVRGCERFDWEQKDCTVRAIANACNAPYDLVHTLCKLNGRKDKKGWCIQEYLIMLARRHKGVLGHSIVDMKFREDGRHPSGKVSILEDTIAYKYGEKVTLRKFLSASPKGNYIVIIPRHALAIKDGVIFDFVKSGPNSQISCIFKLTPIKELSVLS